MSLRGDGCLVVIFIVAAWAVTFWFASLIVRATYWLFRYASAWP